MRALTSTMLMGFLAACAPNLPDSGAGAGFDNSDAAQRAREAELDTGQPLVPGPVLSDEATSGGLGFAQPTSGGLATAQPTSGGLATVQPTTVSIGLSPPVVDEAYSARQIAKKTPIPLADGSQTNIVEYALSTSNPPGTKLYSRSILNSAARTARNCAKFTWPDEAQIAFLSNGGPQRDRQGLDPDGDGYACSWDPAPLRQPENN
jgi:hypothetical protein